MTDVHYDNRLNVTVNSPKTVISGLAKNIGIRKTAVKGVIYYIEKAYLGLEKDLRYKIVIRALSYLRVLVQGIFAKIGPDLELRGGSDFFTS